MAAFSLFSVPRVPRKKVLELFEPIDLLELSLTSKHSKSAIRNCTIKAKILSYDPRCIAVFFMCGAKSLTLTFTPQISESTDTRVINGAPLLKWTKHPETSTIGSIPRNFDEDILQIFQHFQELFLVKGYQYNLTGFTRSFTEHTMQRVPKTVDTLTIGDANQDDEAIWHVLDNLTVTSQLMIESDITRVHEKMKNLDFLMIRRFNGSIEELATLNSKNFTIWFINDFSNNIFNTILRHWKQSKTQLKSFRIARPLDHLTPNLMTMLNGLNPKHWDYQRRSACFMMGNEEINCSQYKDIERDCDRLLGSFGCKPGYFEFVVWENRFPVRPAVP